MKKELKIYTKSELALRNGRDKEDIWCCLHGNIYDLSSSRMWRDGNHYEHWAGQDLSEELTEAPHSEQVFRKFEIVGLLKTSNK